MTLEFAFSITPETVSQFAEFSGDRNALHLDGEFARRSRFREPVVFGMLVFGYLSFLQAAFPKQKVTFRKLTGQFTKPVFVGDKIQCTIVCNEVAAGSYGFTARWRRISNQEEVVTAQGEFATVVREESTAVAAAAGSFMRERLPENELTIDQLQDREESFQFHLTKKLAVGYQKMLAGTLVNPAATATGADICPNLLATLLLSTLVGMRLPGRFATFLNFEVGFTNELNWGETYLLAGKVEKASLASAKLNIGVKISRAGAVNAEGKCGALVNRAPLKMPSCAELVATQLDLGLKGKVVLVTGASRGIGEVTVKLFAMLGAKVAVHFFRGKSDAQAIVAEIKQAGGEAVAVEADVRDERQVQRMFEAVVENFGGLDVLVNNAVNDVTPRKLMDLHWSDFQEELEVSLKGLHHCCQAAIPLFRTKVRGKIINLSTIYTDAPVSGQAKYIAAKSAVEGYTRSLAKELVGENIQANVVSPSPTETDLLVAQFSTATVNKLRSERPAGRNVQPVEVAQSIVFLASNWANAISGQRVCLNLGEDPFL
jgi:3-oxoacyl-[acyl-carrier protein] reductase